MLSSGTSIPNRFDCTLASVMSYANVFSSLPSIVTSAFTSLVCRDAHVLSWSSVLFTERVL